MASTISFAPPTAQQKACVPDHKRVARISKDVIRIEIDGEEPIFLTGHGICTASSEQDINKIIKFRGATKRKAADGEAAGAEPKHAKADSEPEVPAEETAKVEQEPELPEQEPELPEQEDIDHAADLLAKRQEYAQSQYWDDLTAPAKEEEEEEAPIGTQRNYRRAGFFEPEPEPVYDENGLEVDEEDIVAAAVEAVSAEAIAEAIFGEEDGSWVE